MSASQSLIERDRQIGKSMKTYKYYTTTPVGECHGYQYASNLNVDTNTFTSLTSKCFTEPVCMESTATYTTMRYRTW